MGSIVCFVPFHNCTFTGVPVWPGHMLFCFPYVTLYPQVPPLQCYSCMVDLPSASGVHTNRAVPVDRFYTSLPGTVGIVPQWLVASAKAAGVSLAGCLCAGPATSHSTRISYTSGTCYCIRSTVATVWDPVASTQWACCVPRGLCSAAALCFVMFNIQEVGCGRVSAGLYVVVTLGSMISTVDSPDTEVPTYPGPTVNVPQQGLLQRAVPDQAGRRHVRPGRIPLHGMLHAGLRSLCCGAASPGKLLQW